MTLQQELLKIKKEKRLRYAEIGEALGVSESYAYYLANSKRKIRPKFKPIIKNFIAKIKGNPIETINTFLKNEKNR